MLKKILILIGTVMIMLTLSGCKEIEEQKTDTEILYEIKALLEIDLTNITEDISIPVVDNEDVAVTWESSKPEYLDIDGTVNRPIYSDGNQSISLTVILELNDALVTKSFSLTVIALEKPVNIELNTDFTDALVMDFAYEATNFVADGVGEVILSRCVDGDTAIFTEGSNHFTVRFLGIDTPESTYKFDPWGKAASLFTCDKLENATTIVLEWDTGAETRTDGNGRYLSWVWYDGRLLNLELVEEALTGSKGVGGLKYETVFYQAEFKTQDTDRRIWGEDDPDFDYSLEGIQITIEELVTNPELYVGLKVVIRGIVSRTIGQHPYVQDGDYGIYIFSGYTYTTKLSEGNEILISGLVPTYYPDSETGGLQLTGFTRENAEVLSEGNTVTPVDKLINELTTQDVGSLLKIYNLTVVSIDENSYDDAFTITVEDEHGNTITIRKDDLVSDDITGDLFTIGTTFDIVAPLGRYESNYQLMIVSLDDVTFK
ncbi:MAG: thermonuclease family protein [Candidatus Izimaplasma sp.]|nr:thermonuclease family protein [Candidatus Izimaplasma bacterium]